MGFKEALLRTCFPGQVGGSALSCQRRLWTNFRRRQHRDPPGDSTTRKPSAAEAARIEARKRDSTVLNALVGAGAHLELLVDWVTSTRLGQLVSPRHVQANSWVDPNLAASNDGGLTSAVLRDVAGRQGALARARRVNGIPLNRKERHIVALGIPAEVEERESAFAMIRKLLFSPQYLTTQQQATRELYRLQPDFHEPSFLRDIEEKMLPRFLQAYWARNTEELAQMCTPTCLNIDVLPQLKQYEGLQPLCRLFYVDDANLFNRMMVLDDTEWGRPRRQRRGEGAEDAEEEGRGEDDEEEVDLDDGMPEPRAVLLCSVHVCLINCWVDPAARQHLRDRHGIFRPRKWDKRDLKNCVRIGDPERPEHWVFLLGLTPEERGHCGHARWALSVMQITRAEAMSDE
eukprot:Hpha_TRINITY_DN17325_c0_g1::TRINITY_DN17325_c0_g1_i1::g.138003::m.138003